MTVLDRVVEPPEDDVRVDVALAAWLDESRARAQGRLDAGEVTVDGAPVAKAYRLRAGQRVHVAPPPAPDVPAPEPVPVRYEDDHLLVVAKPAGLLVHPGAGQAGGTLVEALVAMGVPLADSGDPVRPGIVHRLDRGTSGVLAVAKTPEAHRGLSALLAAHDVERVYTALVEGVPARARATIDAPIARSQARRTRFVVETGGRRAVTHYDVDEDYGRAAALTVRLDTGRTHQVRVHLAAVGHPVCGDRVYGASAALAGELGLDRPGLHARRLAFTHPVTGAQVAVDEPVPGDLAGALAVLRGE